MSKIFSKLINAIHCYKLEEVLIAADILYEDGAHDGLIDAYNTALLFTNMELEPYLKPNPIYEISKTDETNHLHFTIGSILSSMNL